MNLPTVIIPVRRRNPDFVAKYEPQTKDGITYMMCVNSEERYVLQDTEVEIVQLNLNTAGMRVRYVEENLEMKKGYEVMSLDVSIQHFFDKYDIVEKV